VTIFSFDDSAEVEFGLPIRHFSSFRAAAAEAAISRFMEAFIIGQPSTGDYHPVRRSGNGYSNGSY